MRILKQLFCDHYFQLDIHKDYRSVSDEAKGIESAIITLSCGKCNKTIKIIDRQRRYIDWLRSGDTVGKISL